MFEREARLHDFVLAYYRRVVEGIDDARLAEIPAPGLKPPVWMLGHLAIANDYALDILGRARVCPEHWHADFGPGSVPLEGKGPSPSRAELVSAFERGHGAVREALPSANPEAMAAPNPLPMPFLQENLPTVGDLLAHLLTTHASFHLGQISTWRRASGLPEVF